MHPQSAEQSVKIVAPRYLVEYHDRYVRVSHVSERSTGCSSWWQTLTEICSANNCFQVLSEAELFPASMSLSEAFETAVEAAPVLINVNLAIFTGTSSVTESLSFFQTVASNRGASVETFSSRNEAIDWLRRMADRKVEFGDLE